MVKIFFYFLQLSLFSSLKLDGFIDEISVDPLTQSFIDSKNRQRLFHGINRVEKKYPYYPTEILKESNDPNEFFIESIGLNVVRLGLLWQGVMPELGKINYTYLSEIKKIVKKFTDSGIYTLLDAHQDLFSNTFCGDGFIEINKKDLNFPMPISPPYKYTTSGKPSFEDCNKHNWALYYISFDVVQTFEDLYTNKNGLLNYFIQFFEEVAKYFQNVAGVLGYNIINEPFVGDFYKNPRILVPKNANKRIFEFQDFVIRAIRKYDDKKITFVEGVTYSLFDIGLDFVPGGIEFRNKTALSYHYYFPPNLSPTHTIRINDEASKKQKIGVMLTEFAVNSKEYIFNETAKVIRLANEKVHSWICWSTADINKIPVSVKSNNNGEPISMLKQNYPVVIAGRIIFFKYDPVKNIFDFEYKIILQVTSNETIIFYDNKQRIPYIFARCTVDVYRRYPFIHYYHHSDCKEGDKIRIVDDV